MSENSKSKSKSKSKEKKSSKKVVTKSSSKSKSKDKKDKSPKSTTKSQKSQKSKKSSKSKTITKSNIDENKSEINKDELSKNLLPFIPNQIQPTQNIPMNTFDKCEGCFQGDGYCFCTNCGKIYCKICDDQLHVVPAYRSHDRTLLSTLSNMNANCYHHNQPLRYFCESCDEPICAMCKSIGPHNNQLHHVGSLFEIYRKHFSIVKEKVDRELTDKNNRLENVMLQIEHMIKDTKLTASNILRGINNEYEGIVDNINKCEGKKLAMLNYNAVNIQKDIVAINNIIQVLNSDYGDNNLKNANYYNNNSNRLMRNNADQNETDPISFLLQYKTLTEQIDTLTTKPSNAYTITPQEKEKILKWPEELNENKKKLENHPKLKALLKIKDDIMWNLLITPYEDKIQDLEEIERKTQKEIAEWSKLSDQYANELKKYNMVCTFCGCYLDNVKINENCSCNKDKELPENDFTKTKPPVDQCGNNRHYFSEPTEQYEKMKHMTNEQVFKESNPFDNNMLSSSKPDNKRKVREKFLSESFSNEWVFKIASVVENEKINLFQVLTSFDLDGDGFVDLNELINALKQIGIFLSENEIDGMQKYTMLSNNGSDKIEIKQFASNFMRKKIGEEGKVNVDTNVKGVEGGY